MTTTHQQMTRSEANRKALQTPLAQIVAELQQILSQRVVAFTAGVNSRTIQRWANEKDEEHVRNADATRRLRAAYEIVILLLDYDSPFTVKAWFIGPNPHLTDESPSEAIRQDRLKDALGAAGSFIALG
jgi:hypothetical protein